VVRTHERAVEETELVAGSLLATVAPSIGGTLISILAEVGHSSGLESAGGEVASPRRVDIAGALAAKAERRGIELGNVVRSIRLTVVGDLPVVVDIAIQESSVVDVFGLVEGTVEVRTHRTNVLGVGVRGAICATKSELTASELNVIVVGVINTRDVVAVAASTTGTARLVERLVLATVTRITIAIKVTVGVVASVRAETSRRRGNLSVALGGRSEVTGVSGGERVAVEGGNVSTVEVGERDLRASELILDALATIGMDSLVPERVGFSQEVVLEA